MSQKSRPASDSFVNEGYKALEGYPGKMVGAITKLFQQANPNPQDVADAVVKLIELPQGQRSLRTVVDPTTGQFVKAANEAVQIQHSKTMTAYGLQGLLN